MTGDIFSRFSAPESVGDESSGSRYWSTGGLAQIAEAEVFSAIDRAPALPHIVGQILSRVGDVHSSTADFETLIEQDMVLAGKVLKLVNSAFYRRPQPVGSIREAVSIIGFASLRSLVLAASTSDILMVDLEPYGMARGGLWRNSIATAAVARAVGQKGGVGQELSEEFFAAGLMRDVGLLILSPFLARSGVRLHKDVKTDILIAERRAVGFDHGWVGDRLAEKWQLPEVLRACIASHHRDTVAASEVGARHLGAVRLAERLVYAAGVGMQADHPFETQIDAKTVKQAGLDAAHFAALCAEVPTLVNQTD